MTLQPKKSEKSLITPWQLLFSTALKNEKTTCARRRFAHCVPRMRKMCEAKEMTYTVFDIQHLHCKVTNSILFKYGGLLQCVLNFFRIMVLNTELAGRLEILRNWDFQSHYYYWTHFLSLWNTKNLVRTPD